MAPNLPWHPKNPELPSFYKRLHAPILGYIKSRLRSSLGIDHELVAANVMTDLFNGLWAGKWPRIVTVEAAEKMAFRIARFDVLDAMRKQGSLKENELGENWEDLLGNALQQLADLDAEEAGAERFEAFLDLVAPPEVRPKLFRLYFTRGHTYQQLADQFCIGVGDVCKHFSRALNKLRDLITSGRLDPRTGRLRKS